MKNNRETRMEILTNAGINTNKYFAIPDGMKEGDKFTVKIDENGNMIIVKDTGIESVNEVMNQIIEDGYVKNSKLHRRFVMAQMFHALNYKSWRISHGGNKSNTGFDAWLRDKGYDYSLNMMLEECRVLGKIEEKDKETFEERAKFFSKDIVAAIVAEHIVKVQEYIGTFKTKNCKGVPYVTVHGKHIFVADLNKKVYDPMRRYIYKILNAKSYNEVYKVLKEFIYKSPRVPYDTDMSKVFVNAYKANGAYYTLKNLIMFHGCTVGVFDRESSLTYIKNVSSINMSSGEGWKMLGLLKETIEKNKFDFDARMREIYNK